MASAVVLVAGAAALVWVAAQRAGSGGVDPEAAPLERPAPHPASPERRVVVPAGDADLAPGLGPWLARNSEAVEALEAGEIERAIALLAECHEARPENETFRRNLAEAWARLAWRARETGVGLEEGFEALERAAELAPEREDLARELARWRRERELAEDDDVRLGAYFEVAYDATREDLLVHNQRVLDFLEGGPGTGEGAYARLRDWFEVDPVREGRTRFRVVLHEREEFGELTGLGDWAGGVFDGALRVAVADVEEEDGSWQRVLSHELAHAFVREVGGRDVPGWLNEGLAQLLEESSDPAAARARLAGAEALPLERLRGSLAAWDEREEIALAYAQSLALVDHLERVYGRAEILALLRACGEGRAPDEVFRERNGFGLELVLRDAVEEAGRR